MFLEFLFSSFSFLICVSAFFVAFSESSISSVVFLILVFCNAAGILIISYSVDFLGLIFIVIYVGAIAVLFLFVIMMLPTKRKESSFPFSFFLFLFKVFFVIVTYASSEFLLFEDELDIDFFFLDNLTNISVLGQVLYNYYIICFLISGIILLIALLGSIILTFNFNQLKINQTSFIQISKLDTTFTDLN